jgi:hypothetical protein
MSVSPLPHRSDDSEATSGGALAALDARCRALEVRAQLISAQLAWLTSCIRSTAPQHELELMRGLLAEALRDDQERAAHVDR